jgi:hypothetical protein
LGIDSENARRREPVLEYRGKIYCWPCAVAADSPVSKGFRLIGERPDSEACSVCHRVGSPVLVVET